MVHDYQVCLLLIGPKWTPSPTIPIKKIMILTTTTRPKNGYLYLFILFYFILFTVYLSTIISNSDYTETNDWSAVNKKLERM
jgi:hypothetical protein